MNAFSARNEDKSKGENENKDIDTARGDKAIITNTTMVLIKGMEIIPLE